MGIVNRWYDILELLLARDKLTVEELGEHLELTPYTIKNNIQLLNDELKDIAKIEQEKKQYYLRIHDFSKLEEIMTGTFRRDSDFNSSTKRIAYILRELMLNKEYQVITDLAENLSVSRNTVNNDLKTARNLIEEYNVKIESATGKGIRLVGDNFNKRMVYMNLVQDYFDFLFLSRDGMNHVQEILTKHQLSKKTSIQLLKVFDVLKGAIEADEFLTESISYYRNTAKNSNVYSEIINFFEDYYSISLSQYELDFLSFPFNLTNFNQNSRFIQKVSYLPDVFNFMMKSIKDSFVIDLNQELLYSEISNHLFYLINRSIFYTAPREIFFGEVEEKYPFSFEIAKVAADAIGKKIDRRIDSIEVDYLTLYFEMALRSSTTKKSLNVAIISNMGHGTANIIRKQIDSVVGEGTNFTSLTEENYTETDLSEFFVIFTTVPLKKPPKSVPVIRISNIFSEQWLSNELEKMISTNPNLINTTLYDVYSLDKEKDYLSNLKDMLSRVQNEGLIEEVFIERIIKRERKQKTIFNNGIAFPHAVNPNSQEITLLLGIFDGEYRVNDEDIQIIFLLAVPEELTDKKEEKLLELYDLIFRLANDVNFKNDLSSFNNRVEVIDYLENRRLLL